jgi:hypothetical protein
MTLIVSEDLVMSAHVDEVHNDPQAEIVFVSNDGVSFRVHKWFFQKCT